MPGWVWRRRWSVFSGSRAWLSFWAGRAAVHVAGATGSTMVPPALVAGVRILVAFTEGIEGWPDATFGNIKVDVPTHYVPGLRPTDFVEVVKNSDCPE
ncbi:hypothetical protein ABT173_32930 [Streptomyces sp. NPDC001795]|uniref:hypothetical protein n=2 Tax=unclassified Streptomyces TaxID=2593676 RepID=UPI00332AD1D2